MQSFSQMCRTHFAQPAHVHGKHACYHPDAVSANVKFSIMVIGPLSVNMLLSESSDKKYGTFCRAQKCLLDLNSKGIFAKDIASTVH